MAEQAELEHQVAEVWRTFLTTGEVPDYMTSLPWAMTSTPPPAWLLRPPLGK